METKDQQLVKTILKGVKHFDGSANFLSLGMIPTSERLPALAKDDRQYIHKIIAAQIQYTMLFFNITNSLSLEQIFILSDEIIDSSEEDNLALQDVFLFLQKLSTGEMGKTFNRMDVVTFMEMFETYRDERHNEINKIQYGIHVQNKSAGPSERECDDRSQEKALTRMSIGDIMKKKYK